ncbi:MAG: hypothetical protein AAF546_00195 [Verrucomicrobiota bacterium]
MAALKTQKPKDEFSYQFSADYAVSDDGSLSNVSLLSIGEADGHGQSFDLKSLQTAFALLSGQSLKAFNGHSFAPKASDAVGVFQGIHIDASAGKLRSSTLQWMAAFKKHREAEYDSLLEMAREHPETFGVSVTGKIDLVWVTKRGDEIDAFEDWLYDRPAPEGTINDLPAVRFKKLYSADFVGSPAANDDGLYSSKSKISKPDSKKDNQEFAMNILQQIQSAYGAKPEALAEAINYATANPEADFAKIQTHLAQFEAEQASAAKDAKITELEGKYAAEKTRADGLQSKLKKLTGGQESFEIGEGQRSLKKEDLDEVRAAYAALPAGKERREFRDKHPEITNWK